MLGLVILKKIDFDKLIADKAPSHQAMTEHFGSRNKNSTRRYRYSKRK